MIGRAFNILDKRTVDRNVEKTHYGTLEWHRFWVALGV